MFAAGVFRTSSATPPERQHLEENFSPNCSCEYKTIQNCIGRLEVALKSLDRDTVHFLNQKGFITEKVHDDVLNPRSMLTDDQKSGELVTGIRNQVELSTAKYHILVDYFRQRGKQYDSIVKILDEEYNRQQQKGKEGKVDLATKATPESCFLARYKKFLMGIYDQDPIARDDKLAIFPCDDFISLALVNRGQRISSDDSFTISTLHGSVDEILATKTPLEMDALVTPGSRFVLVEGPPGIGKSTLCWELCRKWDTLKSLQDFKIVLLLKLRERCVQNVTSLHELFLHDDKKLCDSIVDLVFSCNGEGVLLVLDGFDELPSSVVDAKNSLIMQLIRGHCLPSATRLITSRPSALDLKSFCFPQKYRHVEILGFTDENKALFAEKAFADLPEVLIRFKQFIFSNPIITSLMYIPVNCAIIAQVYKELPDIVVPKTMTQLYTLLVLVLIRRHLIQTERWTAKSKVPADLEGLPEDIKADLMRVSELAYKGLMMDDVQITFADEDVGENFQHLGLLNEAKAMYIFKGTVANYSFLHLSIQEFLAAWYVSHRPDLAESAATSILSDNCYIKPHFLAFGRFLSGISENCFKKLCGLLGPNSMISTTATEIRTIYFVCCCYEAKDVSFFESFNTVRILVRDPLEMYQFGYAFVHTRVKWDIKAYTPFGMLASSIADHAPNGEILGSLQLNSCTTCVSEFELLPKCVLDNITLMFLNDVTATILASLPNLTTVVLYEVDMFTPPITSAIQVTSVPNLQKLDIVVDMLSDSVLEELCALLADTRTLRDLCLAPSCKDSGIYGLTTDRHWCMRELWQFQKLSEAALRCSSLQNLHCTIPFISFNYSGSLSTVVYYITGEYSMMTLYDCLINIAHMCKSLSTLVILLGLNTFYILPKLFVNFITILNSSLSSNPRLGLFPPLFQEFPPCHLQLVSTALRKDPDVACQSLKRSKSICDLTNLRLRTHNIRPEYPWQTMKRRYVHQSCPDFSELESLNNMHPQLFNVMGALPKFACTQDVQILSHHT